MAIVLGILFVFATMLLWFANLLGLPGNWMIVAASVTYAWLIPEDSRTAIGWPLIAAEAGLALLGELCELVASAAGVKRFGGSSFSAILALFGSVAGAIVGVVVGTPIPVFGPLVAALLFAGLGALIGAMLGESITGQSWSVSWKIGKAAFWGRLLGTLAKTMIGTIMVGVAVAAVLATLYY